MMFIKVFVLVYKRKVSWKLQLILIFDKNETMSWEKERQELRKERSKALKFINDNPNHSVWELVNLLRTYDKNQRSQNVIGAIFLASDIENYNLNFNIVTEALENSAETLIISYIETIYGRNGIDTIEKSLDFLKGNDELIISILKTAQVDEDILKILDSLSDEINIKFWKAFSIHWDTVDNSVKERVWMNLLEYKNFNALLTMIDLYFKNDLEKNLILLEGLLINQESFTINSQNEYLIVKVFENIYRESNPDIDRRLYLRICHIEWAYFSLLIDQLPPKYLIEELKTDPLLLASLIQSAYKSSKEDSDSDEAKKS